MNNLNLLFLNNHYYSAINFVRDNNGIPDIAFSIGNIEVAWYAILIFIGFLLAAVATFVKAHWWYKIPIEPIFYYAFIAIPLSIFGARAWSFIIGDATGNFFDFQNGGLAIHGGIIFTVIGALIFFPLILKLPQYNVKTSLNDKKQVKRVSSYVYADCILPTILVGQIIGRWGNWVNGEVYGPLATPEQLAWLKNTMPLVYEGMIINGELYQPFFLYESFVNFWIFIFLYFAMEFISFRKAGDIGALYFVFYGLVRVVMEPLRASQFGFVTSLVVAVLMMVFGIIFIIVNHLFLCKNRDKYLLYFAFKYSQMPFKKIYYFINGSYRMEVQRTDKYWKNLGNPKPLKIKKEPQEIFYYNGV